MLNEYNEYDKWLKQRPIPFDFKTGQKLDKIVKQSGAKVTGSSKTNGSTEKNPKTVAALDGLNKIIGQHAANRARSMRGLEPEATDITESDATRLDTSGIVRGDEYAAYLKNKEKYKLT